MRPLPRLNPMIELQFLGQAYARITGKARRTASPEHTLLLASYFRTLGRRGLKVSVKMNLMIMKMKMTDGRSGTSEREQAVNTTTTSRYVTVISRDITSNG